MRYRHTMLGGLLVVILPGLQGQMPAGPLLSHMPPSFGPVPHNCPVSPPFKTIPYFGQAIGHSPVWLMGFEQDSNGMLRLGGPDWPWAHTRYGWSFKMEWALEPGFTHKVTVRGGSLRDGRPIQVSVGPVGVPALTVVLDPRHPPLPIQHGRWTEFPFAPIFHRSGCYFLEANWPRGAWRVSFAAGRS